MKTDECHEMEYTIYEKPLADLPLTEKPCAENPQTVNPYAENLTN